MIDFGKCKVQPCVKLLDWGVRSKNSKTKYADWVSND